MWLNRSKSYKLNFFLYSTKLLHLESEKKSNITPAIRNTKLRKLRKLHIVLRIAKRCKQAVREAML